MRRKRKKNRTKQIDVTYYVFGESFVLTVIDFVPEGRLKESPIRVPTIFTLFTSENGKNSNIK